MAAARLASVDDIVAAVGWPPPLHRTPPDDDARRRAARRRRRRRNRLGSRRVPALTTLLRYIYRAADAPPPTLRGDACRVAASGTRAHFG